MANIPIGTQMTTPSNVADNLALAAQEQQALQAINDPYSVTPSPVVPDVDQATIEQIGAQGSYPQIAGGPEDLAAFSQKVNALNAPVVQDSRMPATETAQASADQFAPQTSIPQQPQVPQPTNSADQQALTDLQKAYDKQERGLSAAADAGALKAQEEAAYREGLDQQFQTQQAKVQENLAKVNEAVDMQLKDLETVKQELQDFKFSDEKVDPRRLWNDASTGSKILAGISIALGGIGGAFTGKGDNKALDIINRAIDKDIEGQKFNIQQTAEKERSKLQNLRDRSTMSSNLISNLNQKFNNSMQADQAARYVMLEQAKNRLEGIAAKYQAPELKAKAQQLMGQLDEEQAKTIHAFRAAAEQKEIQKQLLNVVNQQPGNLSPAQVTGLPKELQERYVQGYGFATNPKNAEKFQEYRAEVEPAMKNAKEVYELGKQLKVAGQLNPLKRAEIESRLAILAGQLRLPITGPGALTDDEYKRLRTTVGDPKKIMGLNAVELKKLETVTNWLDSNLKSRASQYGLAVPRAPQYNKDLGFKPSK